MYMVYLSQITLLKYTLRWSRYIYFADHPTYTNHRSLLVCIPSAGHRMYTSTDPPFRWSPYMYIVQYTFRRSPDNCIPSNQNDPNLGLKVSVKEAVSRDMYYLFHDCNLSGLLLFTCRSFSSYRFIFADIFVCAKKTKPHFGSAAKMMNATFQRFVSKIKKEAVSRNCLHCFK